MNPRSNQSYRAALLQPAKQSCGTQQQITSFMRELTAEDLAEKEQRAQEEREAALERAEEKRRRLQAEQVSLICIGHAIEFLTSPYLLQGTHTCNHRPEIRVLRIT